MIIAILVLRKTDTKTIGTAQEAVTQHSEKNY
jgi:hypothetical protein